MRTLFVVALALLVAGTGAVASPLMNEGMVQPPARPEPIKQTEAADAPLRVPQQQDPYVVVDPPCAFDGSHCEAQPAPPTAQPQRQPEAPGSTPQEGPEQSSEPPQSEPSQPVPQGQPTAAPQTM